MTLTHLFMALYHSEGWYLHWLRKGSLHSKARAMVLYDRVLNNEMGRLDE